MAPYPKVAMMQVLPANRTVKKTKTSRKKAELTKPKYKEIAVRIYLDDNGRKLTAKKLESMAEEINYCSCWANNLNCSDNRCENRRYKWECRDCKAPNCQNQNIGKRKYAPIEHFKTEGKGFGIRATALIKKGTFIIDYIGEVIGDRERARRNELYDQDPNHCDHYMMLAGKKVIDATTKGNLSRLINHSCDPNARDQKWIVPGTPEDIPHILLFAARDIEEGEEITFDYQMETTGTHVPQECHCGAPTCKKFVGRAK